MNGYCWSGQTLTASVSLVAMSERGLSMDTSSIGFIKHEVECDHVYLYKNSMLWFKCTGNDISGFRYVAYVISQGSCIIAIERRMCAWVIMTQSMRPVSGCRQKSSSLSVIWLWRLKWNKSQTACGGSFVVCCALTFDLPKSPPQKKLNYVNSTAWIYVKHHQAASRAVDRVLKNPPM